MSINQLYYVMMDREEIECLTVVDFCRRAGIEVLTVSVTGKRQIMGAHQIFFMRMKCIMI